MTTILNFFIGAWGLGAIAAAVGVLVLVGIMGRAVPFWAWVAVVAALSLAIFAQRDVTMRERAANAVVLKDIAEKTAEAHRKVNEARETWNREFGALDTKHTKEMAHAKSENNRLRAAARSGAAVVRIKGAHCPGTSAVPQTAATGSVGHAEAEVGGQLREDVFDHREALIEAERQIDYLQGYIRRITEPVPALRLRAP